MSGIKEILKGVVPEKYRPAIRRYLFKLKSFPNLGAEYYCPCCEVSLKKFLPYGVGSAVKRPNALCPLCGSLERHRLLWLYLKNRTNLLKENITLLHIAPEPVLRNKFRYLKNVRYVSVDLCSPLVSVKTDITRLSFRDRAFDAIFCSHIMEHIPDDAAAMRELYRVLKPGGWAIIQSPLDPGREETYEDPNIVAPEDRERAFGQSDHVRIYGRDYGDRLGKAGFEVTADGYVREIEKELAVKFGLMIDEDIEDIYVCTKPAA